MIVNCDQLKLSDKVRAPKRAQTSTLRSQFNKTETTAYYLTEHKTSIRYLYCGISFK